MKIAFLFSVLFTGIALFSAACSQSNTVYSGSASPGNALWHKDSSLVFNVAVDKEHLNVPCNIEIGLINYNDYPYSNIWLFVEMVDPNGNVMNDRPEYSLCNNKGQWWGNKSGDVWILNALYKKGVTFLIEGTYTFRFKQGMRKELLNGFKQLDFKIKKVELKKVKNNL